MPAKIVENYEGRTRDHWIEHEIVRVGKGNFEIPLNDATLSGHILSVQYDEEEYFVYNRGDTSAKLGRGPLSYNARTVWSPGTPIRIGKTELRLEVVGDPKPAPRPAFAEVLDKKGVADEMLRPDTTVVKKKMDANALINVLIVFGIVAAAGIFVAGTFFKNPVEEKLDATELERILKAVDEEWSNDPKHTQMRECFQFAFAAESRQRYREAFVRYRIARDLILKRMSQKNLSEPYGQDVKLLNYIKRKMERLSSYAG